MHMGHNSEVALHRCSWGKSVLNICSKFTGEHPCQNVISVKLQSCNFIEIILEYGCSPVIFFLSEFYFTNIRESQDCRGRGRAFH